MSDEPEKINEAENYALDKRYAFNKIAYLAQVIFVRLSTREDAGYGACLADVSYALANDFYKVTLQKEQENEAKIAAEVEKILGGGRE